MTTCTNELTTTTYPIFNTNDMEEEEGEGAKELCKKQA